MDSGVRNAGARLHISQFCLAYGKEPTGSRRRSRSSGSGLGPTPGEITPDAGASDSARHQRLVPRATHRGSSISSFDCRERLIPRYRHTTALKARRIVTRARREYQQSREVDLSPLRPLSPPSARRTPTARSGTPSAFTASTAFTAACPCRPGCTRSAVSLAMIPGRPARNLSVLTALSASGRRRTSRPPTRSRDRPRRHSLATRCSPQPERRPGRVPALCARARRGVEVGRNARQVFRAVAGEIGEIT